MIRNPTFIKSLATISYIENKGTYPVILTGVLWGIILVWVGCTIGRMWKKITHHVRKKICPKNHYL